MRFNDQKAAIAPVITKIIPITHPHKASTYGSESTPEPIADAHNENIEPLKEPFSSFPNALEKKGLD